MKREADDSSSQHVASRTDCLHLRAPPATLQHSIPLPVGTVPILTPRPQEPQYLTHNPDSSGSPHARCCPAMGR